MRQRPRDGFYVQPIYSMRRKATATVMAKAVRVSDIVNPGRCSVERRERERPSMEGLS